MKGNVCDTFSHFMYRNVHDINGLLSLVDIEVMDMFSYKNNFKFRYKLN